MGITIGTRIFTWLRGEEIGRDAEGNVYYRERGRKLGRTDSLRQERRWVIYHGEVEASRVPPDWHAWLHHTTDEVPPPGGIPRRPWQKEHQPNLTGTEFAYRPPGHTLEGGHRAATGGDYEPWQPG